MSTHKKLAGTERALYCQASGGLAPTMDREFTVPLHPEDLLKPSADQYFVARKFESIEANEVERLLDGMLPLNFKISCMVLAIPSANLTN
jgi:hypothetical protein